jgi:hypothetical protein
VLGNLVVGDLALAELANLRLGGVDSGPQAHPGHHDLAQPRIGNADDLHLVHLGVGVEELLHLAGIDVFAAADDHVARAAGEVDAAVFVHDAQVAGVQPAVGADDLAVPSGSPS